MGAKANAAAFRVEAVVRVDAADAAAVGAGKKMGAAVRSVAVADAEAGPVADVAVGPVADAAVGPVAGAAVYPVADAAMGPEAEVNGPVADAVVGPVAEGADEVNSPEAGAAVEVGAGEVPGTSGSKCRSICGT